MFLFKYVLVCLVILYPFLVYFGLSEYGPRIIAVVLFIVILLRLCIEKKKSLLWLYVIALLLCLLTIFQQNEVWLKFYPVLMNFGMLLIFLISFLNPPSIIEQFARLKHPDLDQRAINWINKVTITWMLFFIINGLIALYTVLFSSIAVWTLYNGLISYLIIGGLILLEWILRTILIKPAKT